MSYFDLYGFHSSGLSDAKLKVETALGVQFTFGHGDYAGRYCRYADADNVQFRVRPNYNEEEEDYEEPEFQSYPFLLYVSNATRERAIEVESLLTNQSGVRLLRREDL